MFQNIRHQFAQIPWLLSHICKRFPIELSLIIYGFSVYMLWLTDTIEKPFFLVWVPAFITISYFCNNLRNRLYSHILYYLSWIPLIPLSFCAALDVWIKSSEAWVMMGVLCPLGVLLARREFDNRSFISDGLDYLRCLLVSGIISGIIWGIFCAIFFSVLFIFDIRLTNEIESNVIVYSFNTSIFLIAPIWFLGMLQHNFAETYEISSISRTLLNYIITPALLIYSLILYAYFIRIVAIWELPNGGIAYMVFGFIMVSMVVKALRQFDPISKFNWFFEHFSLLSIPALIMFWIGAWRRISEYGLTEDRFYLLLSGIIMTSCVFIFLINRLGRYAHVAVIAFVLFAMTVFIPYFSPQCWAIRSQLARVTSLSNEVKIMNDEGVFIHNSEIIFDSELLEMYHKIYRSLIFLEDSDEKILVDMGLTQSSDYLKLFPSEYEAQIIEGVTSSDYRKSNVFFLDKNGISISQFEGFSTIYLPTDYGDNSEHTVRQRSENGQLYIMNGDQEVFSISEVELIEQILKNQGYSLSSFFSEKEIQEISNRGLTYRTDSVIIRLSNFWINNSANEPTVDGIKVSIVMTKE